MFTRYSKTQSNLSGMKSKSDEPTVISESILPGVDRLFHVQRGSSGIYKFSKERKPKRTLSLHLKLSFEKHELFDSKIKDKMNTEKLRADSLLKTHIHENASKWCWLLCCDFNLLLFGLGSKQKLMETFFSQYLNGEDVLEIDAPLHTSATVNSERLIRELLGTISDSILQLKDIGSNLIDVVTYTKTIIGLSSEQI